MKENAPDAPGFEISILYFWEHAPYIEKLRNLCSPKPYTVSLRKVVSFGSLILCQLLTVHCSPAIYKPNVFGS